MEEENKEEEMWRKRWERGKKKKICRVGNSPIC